MIQRVVDNAIAVTKESVKTVTYESLNNIVRLINGISALLLAFLPGKASVLEGLHGWELRPTFRAPKFPRWMENGASSFNQIIYELSSDKEGSNVEYKDAYSDDDSCPSSPCLQGSRLSRAQSMPKQRRSVWRWIGFVFYWIFFPVRFLLGLPGRLFRSSNDRSTRNSPGGNRFPPRGSPPLKKMQSLKLKNEVIQRATDRRRGVIEDLHLAIEMVIEAVFDVVHKIAHFVLHPVYAIRTVFGLFSRARNRNKDTCDGVSKATVLTATLGDGDSAPSEATERKTSFQELNTDARTCQDVITELGYPYEAIHVITDDGYVLLLERIPRRDSRKAVYLQHGILDSSMGWVANGVVGSPAFAAYDQGYDVFLGNFRGLVSREHVDKRISSRKYWQYSINEHGTQDIPAMIEKIHQIKTAELKLSQPEIEEKANGGQPYKLCAVCHSLGGAGILMYVVTQRIKEKPHRLSRLILLSPAGFHEDSGLMFSLVANSVKLLAPILQPLVPGIYIPTRFFRMLLNKLARDFHNYPAIGGLVQTVMSYFVCGDSSNWVGVLGLPHYNMNDMPGVSFQVAIHLAQMKRARRFRMFDYGRASANTKVYGSPEPWDLGEHYGLIDIPVDLVAGMKDKIIRPSMVKKHYNTMRDAGVDASYNMFEYAHLDFTFSHREELLAYVMSRLLLVEPAMKLSSPKGLKIKKKGQQVNN